MKPVAPNSTGFRHRLALSFSGSTLVLVLAGVFALYLMHQLSAAVEQVIGEILPASLVATRLSENSALLTAAAPSLAYAKDPKETQQVAENLDQLIDRINLGVSQLRVDSQAARLQRIQTQVATLADNLKALKGRTNERIILDAYHAQALTRIHEVHSELVDTVSPVVWGVSSLTRLMGKRTARAHVSDITILKNRYVNSLLSLIELKRAYHNLVATSPTDPYETYDLARLTFVEALETATVILTSDQASSKLVEGAQALAAAGDRFRIDLPPYPQPGAKLVDVGFESKLARLQAIVKTELEHQFENTTANFKTNMSAFVENIVYDMQYASNIKAEGNLAFALLTAVADVDSEAKLSNLQQRFKRSRDTFKQSTSEFQHGRLARRNPILADTVLSIDERMHELGSGPQNLFQIRRRQLGVNLQIEHLLSGNRVVAEELKQQVEALVETVLADAAALGLQMEQGHGINRLLLILVFAIGFVLLGIIAYFSIRTLEKQDNDIRRAATVFESTSEGVIVADPQARIVATNNAFCEASGYAREQLLGRHALKLRSERHNKAFYKEMQHALLSLGQWQGEIYTRKSNGSEELDWLTINAVRDDHGKVSQYVAVFSDDAIVKRSLEQLDHLAHHDTLTGLPNRLLLRDRLEHAIRRAFRERQHLAVLFLDLDRFKNINDTLGHTAGDDLLRQVAERLSHTVRGGDTVARLGGDEFMVLLEDYRCPDDARVVAQKILDTMHEAFDINGSEFFVTASIGISVYPGDGLSADKLIRNADTAMYRAKDEGKNNYQFYTTDLTIAARERLRLESYLRHALERDEFELFYQPKWDTISGKITGVEALLRWHHPEQGLIAPIGFISTLEESGLILPVGEWVMKTACRQAQLWHEQGFPDLQMSINVSGRQITQGNLLELVNESLQLSGLEPHHLELEVTEGYIMQQPDEAVVLLNALRSMGISIAIDDFGTGYSSLSYLKQLPIQKLKIDRSFVRDIPDDVDDMAITSAIIALAHRLQMTVVAEGVETHEQLNFLVGEECQEAQGYLLSMPLPCSELEPMLQKSRQTASRRA